MRAAFPGSPDRRSIAADRSYSSGTEGFDPPSITIGRERLREVVLSEMRVPEQQIEHMCVPPGSGRSAVRRLRLIENPLADPGNLVRAPQHDDGFRIPDPPFRDFRPGIDRPSERSTTPARRGSARYSSPAAATRMISQDCSSSAIARSRLLTSAAYRNSPNRSCTRKLRGTTVASCDIRAISLSQFGFRASVRAANRAATIPSPASACRGTKR